MADEDNGKFDLSRIQHFFFPVATFSIGAIVGLLTALSNSPVVATIIPLLFALIAGGSGLFLVREDITQKGGRQRLFFAGFSITLLCIGLSTALITTLWLNSSKAEEQVELTSAEISSLDQEATFQVLELRLLSKLLGASANEITAIQKEAIEDRVSIGDEVWTNAFSDVNGVVSEILNVDLSTLSVEDDVMEGIQSLVVMARVWQNKYLELEIPQEVEKQSFHLEKMSDALEVLVGSEDYVPSTEILQLARSGGKMFALLVNLRAAISHLGQLDMRHPAALTEDRGASLQLLQEVLGKLDSPAPPTRPLAEHSFSSGSAFDG